MPHLDATEHYHRLWLCYEIEPACVCPYSRPLYLIFSEEARRGSIHRNFLIPLLQSQHETTSTGAAFRRGSVTDHTEVRLFGVSCRQTAVRDFEHAPGTALAYKIPGMVP